MASDHAAPAARGHNPRLFKDGRSVLFDVLIELNGPARESNFAGAALRFSMGSKRGSVSATGSRFQAA
jgi:hypothetical protein